MLEQGQLLEDCTLIRHLAEHDARHEYLVMSPRGERKLVHFRDSANWSRLQRQTFHDQLNNLSSLDIPSACLPERVLEKDGETYCLYPLPPGLPLREFPVGKLSARAAVELLRSIAELLEVAHHQQVFHGGLSPHTIYLEEQRPWLADFSLAALVSFDYRSGIEVEYASPEQIRGESPGLPADIYSLGCLLYTLLTGRPPFSGEDAFSVGMQHLNDKLPELPAPLLFCTELLGRMTAGFAGDRPTIQQVLEQVDALLQRSELDQVPPQAQFEYPVITDQVDASADAKAQVARIEDQLRKLESTSAAMDTDDPRRQQEEELPTVAAQTLKPRSASRLFTLAIGGIIGFCLGALAFDFFLTRSEPVAVPQVYPLTVVTPDFDAVARSWLQGDLGAAEQELNRLLINFPDHPQVYNNLAAVAAARGDIEEARSWLEQAMVLDTQAATIHRNLGEVYAEMARDSYGRALQLDHLQTALQLDLFFNQGVVSWPAGADAILARVESDEKSAVDVPVLTDMTTADEAEYAVAAEVQEPSTAQEDGAAAGPFVAETEQFIATDTPLTDVEILEPVVVVPEPVTAAAPVDIHEDPIFFLERWAEAWSNQDIEKYLSFYSEDFIPAGGLDRSEWVAQRRDRLQRPDKISVTLVDVDVRDEVDGLVQIEVIQDYVSERYSDRTRKLFDLRRSADGWNIERERTLELMYR